MTCSVLLTLTSRNILNRQRVIYWIRCAKPAESPAAGDQHVDVRVPAQEFPMRLTRCDHAGYDIVVAPQQLPGVKEFSSPSVDRRDFLVTRLSVRD